VSELPVVQFDQRQSIPGFCCVADAVALGWLLLSGLDPSKEKQTAWPPA
jgi:hypothetical protein